MMRKPNLHNKNWISSTNLRYFLFNELNERRILRYGWMQTFNRRVYKSTFLKRLHWIDTVYYPIHWSKCFYEFVFFLSTFMQVSMEYYNYYDFFVAFLIPLTLIITLNTVTAYTVWKLARVRRTMTNHKRYMINSIN